MPIFSSKSSGVVFSKVTVGHLCVMHLSTSFGSVAIGEVSGCNPLLIVKSVSWDLRHRTRLEARADHETHDLAALRFYLRYSRNMPFSITIKHDTGPGMLDVPLQANELLAHTHQWNYLHLVVGPSVATDLLTGWTQTTPHLEYIYIKSNIRMHRPPLYAGKAPNLEELELERCKCTLVVPRGKTADHLLTICSS